MWLGKWLHGCFSVLGQRFLRPGKDFGNPHHCLGTAASQEERRECLELFKTLLKLVICIWCVPASPLHWEHRLLTQQVFQRLSVNFSWGWLQAMSHFLIGDCSLPLSCLSRALFRDEVLEMEPSAWCMWCTGFPTEHHPQALFGWEHGRCTFFYTLKMRLIRIS